MENPLTRGSQLTETGSCNNNSPPVLLLNAVDNNEKRPFRAVVALLVTLNFRHPSGYGWLDNEANQRHTSAILHDAPGLAKLLAKHLRQPGPFIIIFFFHFSRVAVVVVAVPLLSVFTTFKELFITPTIYKEKEYI